MYFQSAIQSRRPVIHALMNHVASPFVANGLLAIGALPVMAEHPTEMKEVTRKADGLVINTGTPSNDKWQASLFAGKEANQIDIPIVIDPVGVGLSSFRLEHITQLLEKVQPTVIKANHSELLSLAQLDTSMHCVDATKTLPIETLAKQLALHYQAIIVATGETDFITDGIQQTSIHGGSQWMSRMTGTGCLLGGVIAAYLAVTDDKQDYFTAVEAAIYDYKNAAQTAEQKCNHFGFFKAEWINQLAQGGK